MIIKSVKLKNDYRTAYAFVEKGTPLMFNGNTWEFPRGEFNNCFRDADIMGCKTDLFEIEYEQERRYVDVRIEVAKHCSFFSDKRFTEIGCKKVEEFIKKEWNIPDAIVTKLGEGIL